MSLWSGFLYYTFWVKKYGITKFHDFWEIWRLNSQIIFQWWAQEEDDKGWDVGLKGLQYFGSGGKNKAAADTRKI